MSAKPFKGLVFTGREHHAKRLADTMKYLSGGDFSIEYITSNNVLNADDYESPLISQGLPYHHLLDFLSDDAVSEINRRNDQLQTLFHNEESLRSFSEYVPEFYLRFSLRDAIECLVLFDRALESIRPDAVFILHEGNFWTKPLAYLARQRDIEVFSFQEGQYETGSEISRFSMWGDISVYSTLVFLWGSRDVDTLNCVPQRAQKLTAVGVPHFDRHLQMTEADTAQMRRDFTSRHRLKQGAPTIVFAAPHSSVLKGSFDTLLKDLIEFFAVNTHLSLIIRFHPFEPWFAKSLSGLSENSANIRVDQETESLDLIVATDLCLCQRSTIGLEYLAFGRPLIELNYQHSESDPTSFYNRGIASLITEKSQFHLIEQTLSKSGELTASQKIEETIEKYFFKTDGQTNRRISEHIHAILSAKR